MQRPSGEDGTPQVLITAATHGNEPNAAWLLESWPEPSWPGAIRVRPVTANPDALACNRRYIDCDLNRSFLKARNAPAAAGDPLEVRRARDLLRFWGTGGEQPCSVAIDLHSTTAAMGACLVVYGRRGGDLALAAGIQRRLGLPVYLHEGDASQTGFLVEAWPCGVVIEVGPVAQGVLDSRIIRQTRLALETAIEVLQDCRSGAPLNWPAHLEVHRHLGSLDVPRDGSGEAMACIHPARQGRDWQPLALGDPLFEAHGGEDMVLEPHHLAQWSEGGGAAGPLVPVFINEAAYREKGIAMSFTVRECWPVEPAWIEALQRVLAVPPSPQLSPAAAGSSSGTSGPL
ncbi:aspartoacylase [Synechococcus sp. RSCCF101]|uniref:aspartoacylase n=1 Tax=Synechococcus sp. RSCCF101 TaxID=2511069 RepID=UPI001246FF81|nr:aspartoacylase [Synechococcus sp. RSCCF101]QEY33071.1 aspartoacylase [Synechococcus sp. RSCCF101]